MWCVRARAAVNSTPPVRQSPSCPRAGLRAPPACDSTKCVSTSQHIHTSAAASPHAPRCSASARSLAVSRPLEHARSTTLQRAFSSQPTPPRPPTPPCPPAITCSARPCRQRTLAFALALALAASLSRLHASTLLATATASHRHARACKPRASSEHAERNTRPAATPSSLHPSPQPILRRGAH